MQTPSFRLTCESPYEDPTYVDSDHEDEEGPPRKKKKMKKAATNKSKKAPPTFSSGRNVWKDDSLWKAVFNEVLRQWRQSYTHDWDARLIAANLKSERGVELSPDIISNRLNNQKVPKHAPDNVASWLKDYKGRPRPPILDIRNANAMREESEHLVDRFLLATAEECSSNTKLATAAAAASDKGLPIQVVACAPSAHSASDAVQTLTATSPPMAHEPSSSVAESRRHPRATPIQEVPDTQVDLDLSQLGMGRAMDVFWYHVKQKPKKRQLRILAITPPGGSATLETGVDGNRLRATLTVAHGNLTHSALVGMFKDPEIPPVAEYSRLFAKEWMCRFNITLPVLSGFPFPNSEPTKQMAYSWYTSDQLNVVECQAYIWKWDVLESNDEVLQP